MNTSSTQPPDATDGSATIDGAREPSQITVPGNQGVKLTKACTIRKPAGELYAFWRDFQNLPKIIKHPTRITVLDETRSRWSVSTPLSSDMTEWDAVVINDKPGSLIAWRSVGDAAVPHAGTVRFEPAPGDEGTEVTVSLEYDPPGGKFTAALAKLSPEEPGRQVAETLRRFKALMEAGEIPTIEGQSVGKPQRTRKEKGKS